MADYYTLLTKAVNGLASNEPATRRAIYERARHALLKQLRSVEPALPEGDITRERLALEEAVRRVEIAMTKVANVQQPPPVAPAVEAVLEKPLVKPEVAAPVLKAPVLKAPVLEKPKFEVPVIVKSVTTPVIAEPVILEALPEPEPVFVAPVVVKPLIVKPLAKIAPSSIEPEKLDISFEQKGKVHFDHLPEARSNKGKVALYLVIGVLLGLATLALLWFTFFSPSPEVPAPRAQVQQPQVAQPIAPAVDKKNDQRIDQDRPVRAPTAPVNAVVLPPKAILYEETPGAAQQGNYLQGLVKWRNESYQDSGQQPDIAIVGEVIVPDRQLKFLIKIKRNQDKGLTASHLVEINTISSGTTKVSSMPGFLMKAGEQTRGQPISAQAAKIIDGFFLIGLSAITADITRNVELMKDWAYLDFPIEFDNRRRAVLTLEKGAEGDKAFAEAFANWGQ